MPRNVRRVLPCAALQHTLTRNSTRHRYFAMEWRFPEAREGCHDPRPFVLDSVIAPHSLPAPVLDSGSLFRGRLWLPIPRSAMACVGASPKAQNLSLRTSIEIRHRTRF